MAIERVNLPGAQLRSVSWDSGRIRGIEMRVPRDRSARPTLDEEWWHRQYAERDLAVLAAREGIALGAEGEA